MTRVHWTGTDLSSSPIGLGGANLGSTISKQESFRLMDEYEELGGNMVDTAQVYANWLPDAERSISETTIGDWMKQRGNRDRLLVTTKGAHPLFESMTVSRMSDGDLREDLEGSLRRLQVDVIDMYWLHRDDESRGVGEIVERMNGFVREGSIRYFGCSNWTAARIREAQQYAAQHGLQGFVGNQMMWSLPVADRAGLQDPTLVPMDRETMELHRAAELTAVPYSSQAQGVFSKWDKGTHAWDDDRIAPQYRSQTNVERFARARKLARELNVPIGQLALAYLTSQPFPTVPIIGCNTLEQLRESMQAAALRLTPAQLDYLDNDLQ
ncbi:aldo/keto reductase [Cohnella thailandensis]|uniref:Aldo/keto reductase n=1 Tax=Cohnella thailandensis TaxID=557557 RepID=A0A841T7G5_9BACL|nr:aldo/keto reductase [Cohnella thailandensis]MBB6638208.1 aldo/keto reductase [Cohnella thailandensis]MBP1977766.1 aryl-alcohol dehydrogenase-like predicted oxidoreductase [Cohnella thailandensis]